MLDHPNWSISFCNDYLLNLNNACALNNKSQVVGHSDLAGDLTFHGFLWTWETGMRDLGVLPGDTASLALGINDRGSIVGSSLDAKFDLHAFLWQDGGMADLNTLVGSNSATLYLLLAESINASGEITGFAATESGDVHGFLAISTTAGATPVTPGGISVPGILSAEARKLLFRRLGVEGR
jgi:probable HAF family extracellular repeat protein